MSNTIHPAFTRPVPDFSFIFNYLFCFLTSGASVHRLRIPKLTTNRVIMPMIVTSGQLLLCLCPWRTWFPCLTNYYVWTVATDSDIVLYSTISPYWYTQNTPIASRPVRDIIGYIKGERSRPKQVETNADGHWVCQNVYFWYNVIPREKLRFHEVQYNKRRQL